MQVTDYLSEIVNDLSANRQKFELFLLADLTFEQILFLGKLDYLKKQNKDLNSIFQANFYKDIFHTFSQNQQSEIKNLTSSKLYL